MGLKGTVIALLTALLPSMAMSQFAPENAAMNNLKKGKWEKARGLLAKSLQKDTLNPSAHFSLSVYFFTQANPNYQIDSAYRYALQASSDFGLTTIKQRERLRKIPLDSTILVDHREKIDSAAFERAKSQNTEAGYIDFLNRFLFASQRVQAAELRDEVAYLDALKENTHGAFLGYLEKYPSSTRAEEARNRYEKLLFEFKTKDKRLASYESFLEEYPLTPYRKEVEKNIFEIATAGGEANAFERFLKKYPRSTKANQARNILYHVVKDEGGEIPSIVVNDSIQEIQRLEKQYLIPFLKNSNFGFMNERGEEVIAPIANQLDDQYLCGNITDEILICGDKILSRNGSIIFQGDIKEVESLGNGFMKIKTGSCVSIIHNSGFSVGEGCIQNAKLIKSLLALQKNNRWSFWTLSGRKLVDYEWDDIQLMGNVLGLRKSGKYKLALLKDISKAADQGKIIFTREFDDVKSWPKGMIWVKTGNEQGVFNQNLSYWISPGRQEIKSEFFGAVSKNEIGSVLHAGSSTSQKFFRVIINQPWVAVQEAGYWHLFDPVVKQVVSPAFDTIRFNGPLCIGERNDSLQIYSTPEDYIESPYTAHIKFIPGMDSLFYFIVEEADKKVVYNSMCERIVEGVYDKIEFNGEGFFKVAKKEKYGLIGSDGKLIVPVDYQALGTIKNGIVQTLRDKKFGMLDILKRKEIKSAFDKNVMVYNSKILIAFKNNYAGLIDWDGKLIAPFEYEEIRYWNDSTALLKKNFNWVLYNFIEKKTLMGNIKTFKWVKNSDEEKVLIVQQENKYGVISSLAGTIIPTTFTDIINLGSDVVPLYFTEKHVEEASIFVVIYYNNKGIQLRRQVFEIEDYEKIYCSDN